jgi:hypothetical protein
MATMAHCTILVMYFVQVVKNVDYFFYLILNSIFTGMTIGVPINEFNEMKDLEVMTFRRHEHLVVGLSFITTYAISAYHH